MNLLAAIVLDDYLLPCLTKKWLGVDCPGCGMQRAVLLFFKGQFKAAFLMYPAIYPIMLLGIFMIYDQLYQLKHSTTIKLLLGILVFLFVVINYLFKLNNLFS
ncbi:MAG: DUF2752 domain-containing protein [Bacteroidota bacterium]